jgi:uncharacterized membrane protein YphA (DoxX/SURF4 family)
LAPLVFRLYLTPIFIGIGAHKFANFEDRVAWFGNLDWDQGLLMVFLVTTYLIMLLSLLFSGGAAG